MTGPLVLPPVPRAGLGPITLGAPPHRPPPGVVRVGFVADVHLGNHAVMGGPREAGVNARARGILDVLRAAVDRAADLGCAALVVAGDLFDDDHPCPQLLAEAAEALTAWRGMPVVLLVGNHDQRSTLPGDHALGPLAHTPGVRVVDAPALVVVQGPPGPDGRTHTAHLACVPYRREAAAGVIAEGLRACLRGLVDTRAPLAVVAHAGVMDGTTPPWLRDSHDALPAEALADLLARTTLYTHTGPMPRGPRLAVVGNWHLHAAWGMPPVDYAVTPHGPASPAPLPAGVSIVQCGALAPTGFDNPGGAGRYGGLIVWDAPVSAPTQEAPTTTPGMAYRVELAGPRFHTLRLTPADVLAACGGATPEGRARFASVEGHPVGVVDAVLAWVDSLADPFAAALYCAVTGPITDAEAGAVVRALDARVSGAAAAPVSQRPDGAPPCPLRGARVEPQGRAYADGAAGPDGALPGDPAGAGGQAAHPTDDATPDADDDTGGLADALRGGTLDAARGQGLAGITRAYVAGMPLPEGVNRERVAAHVARLLGGA